MSNAQWLAAIQVQLPDSVNDTALNTSDIYNMQPAYQVGHELFES